MIKDQILIQREHCNSEAYLLIGDAEDCQSCAYIRYAPCLNVKAAVTNPSGTVWMTSPNSWFKRSARTSIQIIKEK